MRPDPYKRERSRRYLAKQRAAGKLPKGSPKPHDEQDSTVSDTKGGQLPRWIRNLPSNADRFEEEDSNEAIEADAYDIDSIDQLTELLQEINTKADSSKVELRSFDQMECSPLFDELMAIDMKRLESIKDVSGEKEFRSSDLFDDLPNKSLKIYFEDVFLAVSEPAKKATQAVSSKKLNVASLMDKKKRAPMETSSKDTPDVPPSNEDNQWLDDLLNNKNV